MIGNIERFYESGWKVLRATETQDAAGGMVTTLAAHLSVRGRMRPLTGDKRISADKDTYFGDHRFYCSPADILEGDVLTKTGSTTTTYEVKHAPDMMTMGRLMQVDCELVR